MRVLNAHGKDFVYLVICSYSNQWASRRTNLIHTNIIIKLFWRHSTTRHEHIVNDADGKGLRN